MSKFLAEINKFNLDLEISQDKFLKNDIRINFSPIMISFIEINTRIKDNCNKSSYFTSTIFIEGLKINLEEDKLNSNINNYYFFLLFNFYHFKFLYFIILIFIKFDIYNSYSIII